VAEVEEVALVGLVAEVEDVVSSLVVACKDLQTYF